MQQRKSFVHCLPHTHSHAYTNTQTHIHERRSPLPFVTYYCPLVAPGTMVSLNSPFPSTFHSPIHLTPPPVFVPLPPLCAFSLPYHAQTFKGLICCIVWQRAPIMHCCVHSGFAFNGQLKQCQQKQEPWCFVAIVRPGPVSIRYCLVRVPHRNCSENVIRPVEKRVCA